MKKRIGIFSGTFDPVHSGHIAFAKKALKVCRLDKVVFLPEQTPRSKKGVTDITHRIELLKLATSRIEGIEVIVPNSKQFTVKQTLPELHDMFKNTDLTLLIGSDVVKTLPHRWDNLDVLLRDVSLAIGMRTDDTVSEISAIIHELEKHYGLKINYNFIHTPSVHVASSHIRNGAVDVLNLHPTVANYIQLHNLYKTK